MEFLFSVWARENNSSNIASAPGRRGEGRRNGGIGLNQGNGAWQMEMDNGGPRPRHQGWKSLLETMMWSRGHFTCRILSQGREMNEQIPQDNQMLISTCFGAEIISILKLMEHLASRRNWGSWLNMCSRMLGKLHTPNSFSLSHLFRSLWKDL